MTAQIKINWTNDGLNKLKRKLLFTSTDIDDLGYEILNALSIRLHELIVEKAPKDSGDYAKEWKIGEIQDNKVKISNPDNKKFTMLEFTGRRSGRIHGKPLLHFTIDGEDVFVAFVDHPGFQPEPHVRPALTQLGRESKQIILDVIKKKFPMFK